MVAHRATHPLRELVADHPHPRSSMHPAPRVSIVMAVFNDEATIAAALESCLAQTLADVEVICVDDASTDGTAAVIDSFRTRDPRVRVIRQERNLSAFQARRAGILAASAGHVLFLDGDDELKPDAAEKALGVAQQKNADLVGFGVEVVDSLGRVMVGYQSRLGPKHKALDGQGVLPGLFPLDQPAQGQLWRMLFRTQLLRDAYALLPADLVLPRVNDLPLMYLVAALATRYVSIPEHLYRYHFGRGGSGRGVRSIEEARFHTEAIRSVESIAPAVRALARESSEPEILLDNYESVRLSIVGYICSYLLTHADRDQRAAVLEHLHTCASATDIIVAAARFYPDSLSALKRHSEGISLQRKVPRSILLTTRFLTTGGVSGVLLAQADFLLKAGYRVTIVARRHGSDRGAVPTGASFIEMSGRGLPERLVEWAEICRAHDIDVILDHQVLYSRDWPEYALIARTVGVPTIGWLHSFAGRPLYDLNGLHALLTENAPLLATLISLSPLDAAFWKLRGVSHSAYVPNPPSPLLLQSADVSDAKKAPEGPPQLIWWGRLEERTKKISELLDVADHLRARVPSFRLTVIGPDWGEWTAERFNSLARERRLDGYIEAVGPRRGQELMKAIDAADAFVNTSIIEGYPLTIPEAQARGLPVFMYELPWLAVVQDNGGIVSVAQGDAAGLAAQIADALASPERYKELSRSSLLAAHRERSRDFARIYEQVVTGELPADSFPEPTLGDARQLLDLMIFFAEQNSGLRSLVDAARDLPGRTSAPRGGVRRVGPSLGRRAWQRAAPWGRTLVQIFPALRPLADRAKLALARRN
ncbi:glycosyltransferase [Microbacterium sp. RD1]|uniref:glycosyltransferase n=1 Tax=Microbacterium sp. RD1 TaxID=3457313 RepID=UPI003FA5C9B1